MLLYFIPTIRRSAPHTLLKTLHAPPQATNPKSNSLDMVLVDMRFSFIPGNTSCHVSSCLWTSHYKAAFSPPKRLPLGTVNDLINAHFQIDAYYLLNAPSTLLELYWTPLSSKRPLSSGPPPPPSENYSKILVSSK